MRNAYALRRPVANTYLVRERDRRRTRELLLVLLMAGSLGGALVVYIGIHLQVLKTGYRIERLEREVTALDRKERELRLEAAYLSNPSLVESRATRELGMQPPALEQVLFWEELP